jgi:hypothetical protein
LADVIYISHACSASAKCHNVIVLLLDLVYAVFITHVLFKLSMSSKC